MRGNQAEGILQRGDFGLGGFKFFRLLPTQALEFPRGGLGLAGRGGRARSSNLAQFRDGRGETLLDFNQGREARVKTARGIFQRGVRPRGVLDGFRGHIGLAAPFAFRTRRGIIAPGNSREHPPAPRRKSFERKRSSN